MIYPIVVYGDPVLKKKATDIVKGEIDVVQLSEDMFETMEGASGIGLAAPQIGKSIRMFVVDGRPIEEEGMEDFKKVFINPQMIEETGEKWPFEEGCLSIPNIREEVSRNERILIHYFDENWNEHKEEFDGMKARIIQHEYDHIEGVLFTDYLSPLKKRMLKGKLQNITKGKMKVDYRVAIPAKR
ncbi:peptide deformylase [Fulvivirga ligni]|uniref:peptide deformylase n=1 Tax=Fulvivirga ligni TaxID=2904246 RepID=UPI001F2D37B5|nr:peptide deformylase [Fulvivirga ligni]UII21957.1 peptide deformylase [Fulvivirga ligni]